MLSNSPDWLALARQDEQNERLVSLSVLGPAGAAPDRRRLRTLATALAAAPRRHRHGPRDQPAGDQAAGR